jgi:hypothetical protein
MRGIKLRGAGAGLLLALLAIMALGLVAVGTAAAKVNGDSLIRARSLSGIRLRLNTVTGSEIKESTLGQVPSANTANSATNATNATNATTANKANTATVAGFATQAGTASQVQTLFYRAAGPFAIPGSGAVDCPAGTFATGGGGTTSAVGNDLENSFPFGPTRGFGGGWFVTYGGAGSGVVYAICLASASTG